MPLPSETHPKAVSAKTTEELEMRMLAINLEQHGRVSWISIYFDGKNHIAWYYPITNHGGGLF